jgi:nitrate/nitrite transport system ATP-binding protein
VAFIEVVGVSKSFATSAGIRHVLDGVNLSVDRGEFVSIVGFMGCGKSTLLNVVAGLVAPDCGKVHVGTKEARGIRGDAAIVFQNYSLLPWFSALENVRLAVAAAFPAWTPARQREQAQRYLEKVGLSGALGRRPSQLSGGMRQRVAIARAFATEPAILFLDEPFGALDALTRATLQQELVRLCAEGQDAVTTIMITNSLEEALLLSDRIVPMTKGPRSSLGAPIDVAIPRPRTAAQLVHDEQAMRVRTHVVESLTSSRDCQPIFRTPDDEAVRLAFDRSSTTDRRPPVPRLRHLALLQSWLRQKRPGTKPAANPSRSEA